MAPPDIRAQWYAALALGDCVRVMQLLRANPTLLKVGWKSEPSREVHVLTHWGLTKQRWMGRNALHVGAWRGCNELVMQVLTLCNVEELNSHSGGDEQGAESESREEIAAARGASDLPLTEGAEGLAAVADASSEDGQRRTQGGPGPAEEINPSVSTRALSNRQSDEKGQDTAQRRVGRWTSEVSKAKDTTHQQARASSGSSTPIQPPLYEEGFGVDDDGRHFNRSPEDLVSRELLHELLIARDGFFGLEPVVIAGFHFNPDVLVLLAYADKLCGPNGQTRRTTLSPEASIMEDKAFRDNRERLKQAIEEVIAGFEDHTLLTTCSAQYSKDKEFNFLPKEEYLFHFACSSNLFLAIRKAMWEKVRSSPDQLWRFLLELQDGQGRTPAHVAIGGRRVFEGFFKLLSDGVDDAGEVLVCALTTPDAASRSPAHRAAVVGNAEALGVLFEYSSKYAAVSVTFDNLRHFSMPSALRSRKHSKEFSELLQNAIESLRQHTSEIGLSFGRSKKPLHAAILTKRHYCARIMIENSHELSWGDVSYNFSQIAGGRVAWDQVHTLRERFGSGSIKVEVDTMELACLVGADVSFVQFLKDKLPPGYLATPKPTSAKSEMKGGTEKVIVKNPWPALHLAAFSGNYELLKMFTDDHQCNPFIEDFEGNTSLHHAMKMTQFGRCCYHLLDYVSWEHFQRCPQWVEMRSSIGPQSEHKKNLEENRVVERKGCINLLLQLGCDVFKTNKKNQAPYPQGDLSKDTKFLSWWYDKQEKEFGATQNNLNFAANAIAVTATLVATASYVGPLQPPIGYAGDPNQLQGQNTWVLLFIVFDTISFYLAIAAITLSLIPSLPMPQQSMRLELQRTRRMVTLAVATLFPSIICVFLAFGCSSCAVVSASITSSTAGSLVIATTSVGGLFCLGTFCLFFTRLLAFIFPGNIWVRHFYDITSI